MMMGRPGNEAALSKVLSSPVHPLVSVCIVQQVPWSGQGSHASEGSLGLTGHVGLAL